ncbi:MAG: DnaJ domain-containing protein [Bacteroidaceae bacterium]|jgi:curved DNA-binding protein|nr:DnaJ domain-containing protein [Bacteroidaceae bacterium]
MAFIDYYKIMGIDRNTPQNEIRDAYKRRAKQFHPDLHPNDPKAKAKFQALNEAYDVLSNSEKRKKYDQYGENWKNADIYDQQRQNWGQGQEGASSYDDVNFEQFNGMGGGFSSFFEELFGHNSRRNSNFNGFQNVSNHNDNANASVNLDMYTALLGGEIILQTQYNKLRLKVKPCTQNGTKVRLKGKGYERRDGSFGDLIITYNVVLPTSLTERQKQMLREMQNSAS